MGDPQTPYPVVHITGINGKGSTARMLKDAQNDSSSASAPAYRTAYRIDSR